MEKENKFIMKPKVDFCFKELMKSEAVRKNFISAVLGIPPDAVIRTELLPTHLGKEYAEDKLGILDVRVVLNGNIQIDMEIQIAQFSLWPERSLFYLSKIYIEQIKSGEEHEKTILLKWAKFIHAETKEELEMAAKTDPYIGKAYEELLRMSADEEKRREYEARQKAILDHNYLMRINWENGKEEGRAEGYTQGDERTLITLVIKKLKKGCSVPEMAGILEEETVIQKICDTANEFAPEYDADKIMQRLKEKRKQIQSISASPAIRRNPDTVPGTNLTYQEKIEKK